MTVNENHSYDISIKEQVNINSYSHGIYRAFAQQGTFYREVNGQESSRNYHAVISNVKVESGQPYQIDQDGDAFILKIGDANKYVYGPQTYIYSFTHDPGDEGYSDFDDVYQTIISQYMENPIEHLHITINMPKDFDANEVYFYSGSYGSTVNDQITYSVSGKTIQAENTQVIYPGDTVTCRIVLPEGYFVGARTGNEFDLYYYALAAIALIVSSCIYFFIGRERKPLEPVTFYPPNNFDSAQVGYVLNGTVTNESLVSLLIYFADQGWLAIENISANEKKPEFVLHRLSDIPGDRPIYERTIFRALFRSSDNPTLKSLTGKRSMGEAFIDAKSQISDWFSGKNSLVSGKNYLSKALIAGVILLSTFIYCLVLTYKSIGYVDILFTLIVSLFYAVGAFSIEFSTSKKGIVVGILVSGFMTLFSYLFTGNLIFSCVGVILNIALAFLGRICHRYTPEGSKWLGECRGFKHFIQTAELDRIKLLVDENPSYFYNILPYAYAMGLTDQWAKNFEGIALQPPTWYYDPYYSGLDTFRYIYFMNYFNRGIYRNINSIRTESLRSMGSGGFGGGFGGGGGFAGGGGGGMGGGTW